MSDDSTLGTFATLFPGVRVVSSCVGAYTYVQEAASIYNAQIGRFCSIAAGVTIGLAAHPTSMVSTSPVFYDDEQPLPKFFVVGRGFPNPLPRTTVGADVWIGQGAMLKAGISVGIGAVIGAGAIVTRDVAPYSIAAGNPCRVIRMRFDEDVCRQLLASEWWTFCDRDLARLAPLFGEPQALLVALSTLERGSRYP